MDEIRINFFYEKPLHLSKIQSCFEKAFGRKLDLNYWKWRFLKNPNSDKVYINYIEKNEKLLAYYAVSPNLIKTPNGGQFKVALSNMTMTHSNAQGKGYFRLLANKMYKQLKKDGFIGVYGFANHNSHYGFRKYLNWQDLGILNIMCLQKENFRTISSNEQSNINITDSKFDSQTIEIIKNLSFEPKDKFYLSRSEKNLDWRLNQHPNNEYRVIKITENGIPTTIALYKKYYNEIDIIDLFTDVSFINNIEHLYYSIFNYILNEIGFKINIWSNLYSFEHLVFEKLGFKETIFNTYFGIIPLNLQSKEISSLFSIKNWYYRFFDSDIF